MSMGRHREKQQPLWLGPGELPRSPGHRFYEKLDELLREADFDRKVEALCAEHYEDDGTGGRPSIAPGLYFRMLFIGYFEGIESERGLEWRCSDSLSLRDFLGLVPKERVPDHSSLSRIRKRLKGDVYSEVFRLVLGIVEHKGLLKGKVAGVDSTYLRADASMKAIVRKDTGQTYQEYLKKLAEAEGITNPTVEDCRRIDRKRKGKRTSNKDWKSKTDPGARIMKLKDGRTRLAYKAEHVVDMETGAVLAAEIYAADQGDTATITPSLENARTNIAATAANAPSRAPTRTEDNSDPPPPSATSTGSTAAPGDAAASPPDSLRRGAAVLEVVADKGYHKAELLRDLKQAEYRTYISVPKKTAKYRWTDKGGIYTERAYYGNRERVGRAKGRTLMRKRGELIERTFAHICETGGHRRVRLRGHDNLRKRYLMQVAGMNLGLVMRATLGRGTPRGLAEARKGLWVLVFVLEAVVAAVAAVHAWVRRVLWDRLGTLTDARGWGMGLAPSMIG